MKILNTLSHMPFMAGGNLLFCHSDGLETFEVERTETAIAMGIPAQIVSFQPWRLARLHSGNTVELFITPIGMEPFAPTRVFCNPVYSADGTLSFMRGSTLWSCPVGPGLSLDPVPVMSGIFTGFHRNDQVVYATPPTASKRASLVLGSGESVKLPLDEIVRVIPHEGDTLIVTGFTGGQFRSFLWSPGGSLRRIMANGQDVYKCCIDGQDVIHAKKEAGDDARYLHRDPLTLINQS